MKITPTQYAQSLHEATKGKSQKEIDVVIGNFVKVLEKNNQLKLKSRIIEKFSEIYNTENGIVEAEVISREKLSSGLVDELVGFIKKKYLAKDVLINNKIDAKIVGGVIVRVGDEILDGSARRSLKELKNKLNAN